jgi:hypothetical protein
MITFPSFSSNSLILKPIAPYKFCALCLKEPVLDSERCPDCLYPYDNYQALVYFDYDDYRRYSSVIFEKALAHFSANSFLNACVFCGATPVLQFRTVHLYDLYQADRFIDSIVPFALYVSCTGCTLATPLLYLYQFYAYFPLLVDAWNAGESRFSPIKYVDLRLPDWSINYQLLKTIKKYALQYQQNFKPQHDLFFLLTKQQRAAIALNNIQNLIIENSHYGT